MENILQWLKIVFCYSMIISKFVNSYLCIKYCQVQLGPRYEGQLNHMAEPIPHVVRPLVRTHVYHPYYAADRQAETYS